MKKCSKCNIEKPLSNFHKRSNRPSGYASKCKDCRIKYDAKRSLNYIRNYDLKKSYGITLDDYNYMFNNQNGCCAICGLHISELKMKHKHNLCVDHCHITGEIRGLLCDKCNRGIGLLNDDIEILKNAIKYLKNDNTKLLHRKNT